MNILLLQLKRIGDLILTTPAITAVRRKFPEAEIALVVSSETQELLPAIEGVDHTLVARGRIQDAANWFCVARTKYDWCVDFTHNDRSAFLTVLSGARQRVTAGHVTLQSKLRALSYNVLVEASLRSLHTVDYHLALLEPLGIREATQKVTLHLPAFALAEADRVLADAGIGGEFLLLHPGSARMEKFWKAERWREIVDFADRQKLSCVITGGTSHLEQTHIAKIKSESSAPVVDLSGRLDLLTLAALIKKARLLVTVDSAPMHLAAAMQTPQVALFGPTNPLHWGPRFTPAVILQAGEAGPLTQFSPDQKPAPMNLISTGQVIDAMKALLATPRGVSA